MAEPAEEDEIAGLEAPAADAAPDVEVGIGAVRQLDPEALVDVVDEPGAVEAARARAAPAVGDAEEALRVGGGEEADRRRLQLAEPEPGAALDADAERLALH